MGIEYGIKNGALRWIRNPFTGTVVYFNEIHRKPHSFRRLTNPQPSTATPPAALSHDLFQVETQRVQQACVFCPGNEIQTQNEIIRVPYREVYPCPDTMPPGYEPDDWAMRVFQNIVPRIPEECTGGRNESYVIIEDARHFLPGAKTLSDLMWSGTLPQHHYRQLLQLAAQVVRYSMENPTVKSVLIRKHQGRESGASQPHIHCQVIGADRVFPDIEREMEVTAKHPDIWRESIECMRTFGFHLEEGDGIATQWSAFGKFSRQFEVISLQDRQPISAIPETRLRLFSQYVHRLLRALGRDPYDMEIHHGEGIPLHMHVNSRRYVYANIGGTLNVPSELAEMILPPTRDTIEQMARQVSEQAPNCEPDGGWPAKNTR